MLSAALCLLIGLTSAAGEPPVTLSGTVLGPDGQRLTPLYIEAIKQPNAMVVVAEGPPALRLMKRRDLVVVPQGPDLLADSRVDDSSNFKVALPDESPEFGWRRTRLAVWAYHPDFALRVYLVDRDWPRAGLPLSITLPRAAPARLKVTDANGRPVAGARVRPQRVAGRQVPEVLAGQLMATTDAEGGVIVGGPLAKDLDVVRIESDTHGVQWAGVPPPEGDNPATIALAQVGCLTGKLTADDSRAVRRRTVHFATWQVPDDESAGGGLCDVVTDDEGSFQVPAIAAGTINFNIEEGPEPVYLTEQTTGPQVDPGRTTAFEIRLKRAVLVTQEVVDRDDGRPITGVRVLLNSWDPKGAAGTTDESGRFCVHMLPGHVSPLPLRIPPPYYLPRGVLDGQTVREDSGASTLNPLRLARGETIRGRVVDEQQHPLGGAEVVGFWSLPSRGEVGIHAWSDEKGEFSIVGVDRGAEVRLWVQSGQGVLCEATAVRLDTQPATLVVHPEQSVSLEGRLIDAAGKPVANGTVRIWRRQREGFTGRDSLDLGSAIFDGDDRLATDADGWFHTPRVLRPNAAYSLSVEAPGMLPAETEAIEPATWQTTRFADVVLQPLPRLRVVTGRVVDRQGRPVEGARVWQSGDGPRRTETSTDREGRFRLAAVYDGPALVFARRDGFRVHGARLEAGRDACGILLPRNEDPAREMTRLASLVPLEEQQRLTLALIDPLLPILRDPVFTGEHYELLRTIARADPSRALEIADTVLTDPHAKEIARQAAAMSLAEVDVDQAVEIAAVLSAPRHRVLVFLQAVDGLPEEAADRKRQLLEEALLHARGDADAGYKVYSLGQIAERWLDLGDRERGTSLLREGRELARQLPVPSEATETDEAVHMRGRFAGSLARIDGPAALALIAGFGPRYRDRYYARVALGWADYDAAEAERVLKMMEGVGLHEDAILRRMAAVDAQRAARLARGCPDVGERSFALGIVAHGLARSDRPTAQRLLEEAFAMLEEADRRGERSGGQAPLAATAAALLPVAERIDAGLVESYIWRSLALRAPRPARGDPSGMYERGLAQLAAMIAHYDHDTARMLLQPLAGRVRELAAQEGSAPWLTLPVLMGMGVTDARWACELVNALPDPPPTAAKNPKHEASRLLAQFLCYGDRALWRTVYQLCGLRDPNLADEEW